MFDGLASFDREAAAGWLPRFLPGFDAAKQEIRTVTCTVLPLDALALAPCFIKIDVQGLELRVLRGSMSNHTPPSARTANRDAINGHYLPARRRRLPALCLDRPGFQTRLRWCH